MFLRCIAVIPQLPSDCTRKMRSGIIFREVNKHPGQNAPDVTSGLCDAVWLTFLQSVPALVSDFYLKKLF